jgi:hypothetical protein
LLNLSSASAIPGSAAAWPSGGGPSFAGRGSFSTTMPGFHLFAHCQSHLFGGGCGGLCGLGRRTGFGTWPSLDNSPQPASEEFSRGDCSPGCSSTRTEQPPAGVAASNTWPPPSSFCQRSDTRPAELHRTGPLSSDDDGGERRGIAMRLCCRDVQALLADRRGCARKKKGRNAAPNCMTLREVTPRSGALDWPSGCETTLDSLRTHNGPHTSSCVFSVSLFSSHRSCRQCFRASKDPVGQACGRRGWQTKSTWRSVPGRPASGPAPEQGTHAPGPGPDEPVSCGAPIATNCRGCIFAAPTRGGVHGARMRQRTGRDGRRVITGPAAANITFLCCSAAGEWAAHSSLSHAWHRPELGAHTTKTDRLRTGGG